MSKDISFVFWYCDTQIHLWGVVAKKEGACLISKKVRQACLLMWIYGGKIQYMEIVKVSIK